MLMDLFRLDGRMSRGRYLRLLFRLFVAYVAVAMAAVFVASQDVPAAGYVAIAVIAVILIANLAMMVRRLHDRNRAGWWALVAVAASLAVYAADAGLPRESLSLLSVTLVVAVIHVWLFVETLVLRGTPGANRYGPDPLA